MNKEWSEMTSDERQNERFNRWLNPEGINFVSKEAEALYKERTRRFIDVITLKKPDRVPVIVSPAHVPARHAGFTVKEVMYDSKKLTQAWTKYVDEVELDVLPSVGLVKSGEALEIMDVKTEKWPGHGLPDNSEPQVVEGEPLKADEWEYYNEDPSDFQIRAFLPRTAGAAEPFTKLPPLSAIGARGSGHPAFADPEVLDAFKKIGVAGELETAWNTVKANIDKRNIETGLPKFSGGTGIAPLDGLGASLRGTKGIIMDMFRQPDRLHEYMEKAVPKTIKAGSAMADISGIPIAFFPLHRGADRFMSEEQFKTFYWPYLKQVILGYIEDGIVPFLFAEGGYNSRLEVIQELPKGKVIWHFDQTDMRKAKEILGGKACIMGNVPVSLMVTGTTDQVKDQAKRLIDTVGNDGGYILAPGAGSDQTKVENIRALMETAKTYGVY